MRVLAIVRMAVRVPWAMAMDVSGVSLCEAMVHIGLGHSRLFQFPLKLLLDSRILIRGLNLLYVQGYTHTDGEIAFGHGEIPGPS